MGKKKIYETSKITSDSSLLQTSKQGAAVVSYRVQLHSFSSMCEHSQGTQGAPTTTKWQINANPNTPPPIKDFVPSKFSLHSLSSEDLSKTKHPQTTQRSDVRMKI